MTPALEAFRSARANTLPLLEAMSAEDWSREGWHTHRFTTVSSARTAIQLSRTT